MAMIRVALLSLFCCAGLQNAFANDCKVAGVDCYSAARAVVANDTVKNCPTIFRIKPAMQIELDQILNDLRDAGELADLQPSSETIEQCEQRAKEYVAGPQTVRFMELTPSAKERLGI
ncbi:hypothetical protein NKI46_10975 [Mesorhizobium sp. M0615]|uniref:hypothetical protein n=1 Tax=Mesorhizobium sp. M0615 TaxID=2956971 RepID=UPI003335B626